MNHLTTRPSDTKHSTAAFTLVEMLVTISIVALLMGVVAGVLIRAERVSQRVGCAHNLKRIGEAITFFAMEHQGTYPALVDPNTNKPWYETLNMLLAGRTQPTGDAPSTRDIFRCPSDDLWEYNENRISFGLNYDVKKADGTPYRTNMNFSTLTPADKQADTIRTGEIVQRNTFMLVADSAGQRGQPNPTRRFGIASRRIHCDPNDSIQEVAGRHNDKANVLFADNHVELMAASGADDLSNSDKTIHFWTLPADE